MSEVSDSLRVFSTICRHTPEHQHCSKKAGRAATEIDNMQVEIDGYRAALKEIHWTMGIETMSDNLRQITVEICNNALGE